MINSQNFSLAGGLKQEIQSTSAAIVLEAADFGKQASHLIHTLREQFSVQLPATLSA